MVPVPTLQRRLTQLNSVVLPAPFGPIRPQICPALTSNETLSRATIPPKRTDNPLMLRTGALLSAATAAFGRSALSGASVCRHAAITWSLVIAHALRWRGTSEREIYFGFPALECTC